MIKYPARYEHDKIGKEKGYYLEFIDIPDAFTQGYTIEELYEMGQDVLSLILEDYLDENKEIPIPSTIEGDNILHIEPYPEIAIPLMMKKLRREMGLTQEEAAKKLQISYQTYKKIEEGQRVNPTLKILERIASLFNLKLILDFKKAAIKQKKRRKHYFRRCL